MSAEDQASAFASVLVLVCLFLGYAVTVRTKEYTLWAAVEETMGDYVRLILLPVAAWRHRHCECANNLSAHN